MVTIFYQAEPRNPRDSFVQSFTQSENSTFGTSFNVPRDSTTVVEILATIPLSNRQSLDAKLPTARSAHLAQVVLAGFMLSTDTARVVDRGLFLRYEYRHGRFV